MSKKPQKANLDRSKSQKTPPTIAYLAPAIREASQPQWTGVLEAAQKHNVNLICCPGNSPHYPQGFDVQGNIIYNLISAENIDGIVSWASSIGNYMSAEEITAFHESYRPLPVVTIGRTLAGMPGLLMDSYEGMREAMVHLIEVHGHRQVAFVSGPEDHLYAQERYRAYVKTLEAYDLPVDPNLVTPPGMWGFDVGHEGMELLLNERQLRPGSDFTAVVAANDELILGAMAVLQARGVSIPGEVAAIGFDDTSRGQTNTPPLSSVAPPFFDTGFLAVETLLNSLKGDQVPEETTVPSKLLPRQSCGCLLPAVVHVAAGVTDVKDETLEAALADRQEEILSAMTGEVGSSAKTMANDWAERLLNSLAAELNNESLGIFLQELDDMLRQGITTDSDLTIWQEAVSALRRQALPYLKGVTLRRAIDLWEQARITIGEAAQQQRAYQRLQADEQTQALRDIGAALITTFDLEDLVNVLAERLPRLGIPSCYLALYEDPQPYEYPQPAPEWSRLMLAYTDKGRVELGAEGQRFQSHELLPAELWPKKRQYSFVLEPLYFKENQLGYVLFEVGPRTGTIYDALRTEISGALWGALLVEEVQNRSADLARQNYILDSFMANVPDTIYFKDRDSRITQVNRALADRLGVDQPADLIGKTDFDFFPEEIARPKYEQEQEIIRTGQPLIGLEEPDAGGRWVLTTKMPLRNEHNEIIGTFGISRDTTEMKQAQTEIELANQALEVQIWQTTGQAQLNDKMRGEQDIETLGDNIIRQLCHYLQAQIGALYVARDKSLNLIGSYAYNSKKPATNFNFGQGLVGQAAVEKKLMLITNVPDDYITISSGWGETVPRNIMVFPFLYEGQVGGVIELGTLTEFSQTQLEFMETALTSIAIAFNTAQARVRINELLAETQQQAEELQVQGEELRVANEELAAQTESLRASETQLKEKQGELEATNTQLEEKAAALEESSTALQEKQNILDQQNRELMVAQQELERKAKELELASKYKSEFLANMSHELRTPLNSLLILSRMLADNKAGNLTEEQVESSQIIYSGGTDLLNLINDILDLSKVEAGQMIFTFESMPLTDLISTMRMQFDHVAEEKGLDFIVNLTEDLPGRIQTDQQRVKQIVKNLLSNAFKFTKQGSVSLNIYRPDGKVDLSRSGLDPSQTIAVSVADSGIGMTPEQLQVIFEAFQQADGSTSRQYGGTGLGLSISREMTAKLGGQIEVTSETGQGSTFTLYLPIEMQTAGETEMAQDAQPIVQIKETPAPKPAAPAQPAAPSVPRPAPPVDDRAKLAPKAERSEGVKILAIIEDDPKFAKVVYNYAHKKGFKCLIAGEGQTGLELVKSYQPEAIILDLNLPDMSGWEVLTALKNNPETRHIPIHIMSVDDEVLDAYRRGAMGYLTKPVQQESLDKAFDKIEGLISQDIKTLLLVEDDTNSRLSIKKLLEGSDVHISEADHGQAALELLETQSFDCMILDLSLPDMSGFEVLNKMNRNGTITRCPVIIYTGRELTPEENEELMQYADSVIVKGVKSPERLLDETALFLHRVVADMPREKQQAIKQLYTQDTSLEGKKILIVDDDMRNSFALSKLLADKGIIPKIAQNGQKALDLLAEDGDIDLVLMDIMMPVMDGYETTKQIRAQRKFNGLPILALTAKAMKGDREKCLEAGANDYLPKPVDVDRLFSMLRVWLYQ